MLKKVMIICIVFSFVFIGGIAFASGNGPGEIKEGHEVVTPPPPAELNTEGAELEKEKQPEEAEEAGEAKEAEKCDDGQK